ncbi:MAG: pre-peptidase C-terminal domain-containing protein [Phycisphaerales bacterium]|nr:pre-peptidase C-terminal domain-containing protein [Phycisphaerales bacterium]MCI0631830.1 pre-peptidase C-terminal domain-containing protein [Phycisphaerales bacterium]MCI0674560.1 pre-peptidase C-terminal domain-containing protein [Phycisphaerales bacterium]
MSPPIQIGIAFVAAICPSCLALSNTQVEVEPNNTAATANALAGSPVKVSANVYGTGDVDYFSFGANAGDRVYAATMTAFSTASADSFLEVLHPNGATPLESDADNGSFGQLSSSIAGFLIPTSGTYFIRVSHFNGTQQLRGYDLYLRVHAGAPVAEVEPNDPFVGVPMPIPSNGWIAGATSSSGDWDMYSMPLNAGDTIFASVDLDPERNGDWNGLLAIHFNGLNVLANDSGGAGPDSEAFFVTVKDTGTYFFRVTPQTSPPAPFGTYNFSVSVVSQAPCTTGIATTYTGAGSPQQMPTGPVTMSWQITVPGHPRVGRLRPTIDLMHFLALDLDVSLVSPAGQEVALFTDIGGNAISHVLTTLDDQAAIPCSSIPDAPGWAHYQPEQDYRLEWFKGVDAGGTWTLVIRDDAPSNGGTFNSWSLEICEDPLETCPNNSEEFVYVSDFEADDGGFTHSGAIDEWEWGTPSFAPITSANSGSKCWKTDLDGTYDASSSQDLLSPVIDLAGLAAPIYLRWAQKYQMEGANSDHAFLDVENPGGSNVRRLWEWLGATMTASVGNPPATINESAGWAMMEADISEYAGQMIQVRVHFDSDAGGQLAGPC